MICRFGLVASWLAYVPIASAQQPTVRTASSADTAVALRWYLSPIRVDSGYRLTPNGYSGATHVQQIADFAERTDTTRAAPVVGVPVSTIDTWNAVQFVSPQLAGPLELSGLFSGHLDFITNKQDFDFQISLYELTPSADYVLLSTYSTYSTYSTHSSPPSDSSQRTLLQAGNRQHLDYKTDHLATGLIQNGSRLVVLITLLKPEYHIKSAGRDVSDSAIADTREPLRISWYGESYIELRARHH